MGLLKLLRFPEDEFNLYHIAPLRAMLLFMGKKKTVQDF